MRSANKPLSAKSLCNNEVVDTVTFDLRAELAELQATGVYDASSPYVWASESATMEFHPQGYLTITMENNIIVTVRGFDMTRAQVQQAAEDGTLFERVFDALEARPIVFQGSWADERLTGSNLDDRLSGRDGDDVLAGRDGDDRLDGGRGADILIGGRGDDQMRGGQGDDMLVTGLGRDRASGGEGRDLFIDAGEEMARWSGGAGDDMFVIGADGAATTGTIPAGVMIGAGIGGFTEITDFDVGDVLIFATHPDTPPAVWTDMRPGMVLADWEPAASGVDDFVFRDTEAGLEIRFGEEELLLVDVTAKDVTLDQLYFGAAGPNPDDWAGDAVWKAPAGGSIMAEADADGFRLIEDGPFGGIMFETFAGFGTETSV